MSNFRDFFDRVIEVGREHQKTLVLQSWCLQDKDERRIRLQAVIELSVELDKIRSVERFSTAFGGMAIEEIIQGNWKEARDLAQHCRFNDEDDEIKQKYAPIWKHFVFLVETNCIAALARQMESGVAPS